MNRLIEWFFDKCFDNMVALLGAVLIGIPLYFFMVIFLTY